MELLLIAGSAVVVLLIGRWVRRVQSDVDELDDDEYRGPPPFHGQTGVH